MLSVDSNVRPDGHYIKAEEVFRGGSSKPTPEELETKVAEKSLTTPIVDEADGIMLGVLAVPSCIFRHLLHQLWRVLATFGLSGISTLPSNKILSCMLNQA